VIPYFLDCTTVPTEVLQLEALIAVVDDDDDGAAAASPPPIF